MICISISVNQATGVSFSVVMYSLFSFANNHNELLRPSNPSQSQQESAFQHQAERPSFNKIAIIQIFTTALKHHNQLPSTKIPFSFSLDDFLGF